MLVLANTDIGDTLQIIAGIGAVIIGIATVLERRAERRSAAQTTAVANSASLVSEEARRVSESMQSIIDDLREDATRYRTQLLEAEAQRDLARSERRQMAHELANKETALELAQAQIRHLNERVAQLEAQLAAREKP